MAQADLALKELTSQPQAGADIINSVFCDGEEVVQAKDVIPVSEQTTVKKGHKLFGRIRDVFHQTMIWNGQTFDMIYVGFEHQTTVDRKMPIRAMGYDYGKYDDLWDANPGQPLAPVITLVLYFGEAPWRGPRTLYDLLDKSALKRFRKWVNNYKLNVIDMGRLKDKQIRKFRGVFRDLAIAQTYACGRKLPIHSERIQHKEEVAPVLRSLGLEFSDELWDSIPEGSKYMTVFEKLREKDIQKGKQEGILEGERRGERRGKREGKIEGKREGKLEVAEAMLADGMAPEKVAAYTNFPISQILSLQIGGAGV